MSPLIQRSLLVVFPFLLVGVVVLAFCVWRPTDGSDVQDSSLLILAEQDSGLRVTRATMATETLRMTVGDLITHADHVRIASVEALRTTIAEADSDKAWTFVVRRHGEDVAIHGRSLRGILIELEPEVAPRQAGVQAEGSATGGQVAPILTSRLGARFRIQGANLIVDDLDEDSPLKRSGVREDDILVRVGEHHVASLQEFEGVVSRESSPVELLVRRADELVVVHGVMLTEVRSHERKAVAKQDVIQKKTKPGRAGIPALARMTTPDVPPAPAPSTAAEGDDRAKTKNVAALGSLSPPALAETSSDPDEATVESPRLLHFSDVPLTSPGNHVPVHRDQNDVAREPEREHDGFLRKAARPLPGISLEHDGTVPALPAEELPRATPGASSVAGKLPVPPIVRPRSQSTEGRTVRDANGDGKGDGEDSSAREEDRASVQESLSAPASLSHVEPMDDWEFSPLHESAPPAWDFGGWLSAGYHSRSNDLFNDRAGRWAVQQGWLFAESIANESRPIGGRADVVYGLDGADTQAFGNPAGIWDFKNGFDYGAYAWAVPQLYLEALCDDWHITLGHFFSPMGFETVSAPHNFFYSHSITMIQSEPQTLTGVMAERPVSESMAVFGGWTSGWDTAFGRQDGGNTWLAGARARLGDFAQARYVGMFGDLGARGDEAVANSLVLQVNLRPDLLWVVQGDTLRVNATGEDNLGLNHYLLYRVDQVVQVGARVEWWKGDVITGYAPHGGNLPGFGSLSYYAATLGLHVQPWDFIRLRPEARYDWSPSANYDEAYVAMDVILLF